VSGEWVIGSARRALLLPFTDYVFVDMDPRATAALTARLRSDGVATMPDKNVGVTTQNCNDAIAAIRATVPRRALSLVFVDPTNWQVRFDSIAALVDGRATDLLYTFHVGAMRRVGSMPAPALNAFFGTDRWRGALARPIEQRAQALVELYNEQLATLGYRSTAFEYAVPVKNRQGVTMYELILFSRHPLGVKFWREAIAVNELGQRTLWDMLPD
jgi:three-Cys-motif partner protein